MITPRPEIKSGRVIRGADIAKIPERTIDGINPGHGITKEQHGQQTLIRAKGARATGGFVIDEVAELPPIPASGYRFVYWYGDDDSEGGTGDYQIWLAYAGATMYAPLQFATNKSGIPIGTT